MIEEEGGDKTMRFDGVVDVEASCLKATQISA